jgi:tRNA nucleotidyltransferase (CCA-adding enzyme)
MTQAGWEHFDVEADVGVRAWGPTRAAAFAQAALGAFALIVDPTQVEAREAREVRAQAEAPEALLVAWIDECLYVHDIEGFVVREIEMSICSDTLAHGVLRGESLDRARHQVGTVVKGATYHTVAVEVRDGRHEVRVIVDV